MAEIVPSVTATITATIVQVAVDTAKEVQSCHCATPSWMIRNNPFLARGLYCLVMTFKPEADRPVSAGQVNASDLIAKYSQPGELKIKIRWRN